MVLSFKLSAIAQVTKRIRLTSATTVLSTVDPVRLFEDFATLDLLLDGRAEIIAGRGAFIESFPLFGYDTNDYDALRDAQISPRPLQSELPIWVGVGGTLESAARAGRLGVGMAIVLLGGDPIRFRPLVDLYRKSGIEAGLAPQQLRIGITGHGYFAKMTQQAKDEF